MRVGEGIGMGAGRRHGDADTPCAEPDLCADLEEFEAYGGACGMLVAKEKCASLWIQITL